MHLQSNGSLLRFFVLAAVTVALLQACGTGREAESVQRSVVGVLFVTGNESFTVLSLQTDAGAMLKIQTDTTSICNELRKLQGQRLVLYFRTRSSAHDTSHIVVERYELVKNH